MRALFLPPPERGRRPAARHRRRPSDRIRRRSALDRPLSQLSRDLIRWLRGLAR